MKASTAERQRPGWLEERDRSVLLSVGATISIQGGLVWAWVLFFRKNIIYSFWIVSATTVSCSRGVLKYSQAL